jgi:leucyl aminopeptidase
MWKIPSLEVRAGSPGRAVDADVVAVLQDASKKMKAPTGAYAKVVEKFRKGDAFQAKLGQVAFVRFGGRGKAESAAFVGLGPMGELNEERARHAGGHAWTRLNAEKAHRVAVHLDTLPSNVPAADIARLGVAFIEGMLLCAYQFPKHKGDAAKNQAKVKIQSITLVVKDKKMVAALKPAMEDLVAVAECVNITRDWSNEPSNFGTPEYYASEAQRLAKLYGLKCTVLGEKECEKERMGLFLAVSQGSEREAKVVVMEYLPKGWKEGAGKTIAFVGKGVTFDSGGISIKPSARMEEMKHDMTGAATMIGATLLAARLKAPNRVLCFLGLTENMPDGKAIQPGNVVRSRAGKTVEIINTDAEGRLVLADILDYAQDFKPDLCVDAATLTGAIGVALGKQCSGLFVNDDKIMHDLQRAAGASGERLWQMPMFDEYFEDMRSETADMKNSCNDSYGGAIRGAIFMKQFVRKGLPWAHIDLATLASGVSHLPYIPKRGASGLFVRTLARFARDC